MGVFRNLNFDLHDSRVVVVTPIPLIVRTSIALVNLKMPDFDWSLENCFVALGNCSKIVPLLLSLDMSHLVHSYHHHSCA